MDVNTSKEAAIFESALEIVDPAEREKFLDTACGGSETLRAGVARLLEFDDTAGDFLATPAVGINRPLQDDLSGATIDRYRVLRPIGEGGFGIVYLAQQQEPVQRDVAFKIIKLGMDSQHIITRFEAERQALAKMNHANIATVLDAGNTDQGRPYFVMELVDGMSIDQFCTENSLPLRQRLDLFIDVCRATQHAHQKGIIHRDLKPSNILVTDDDGRPVPKIIDFGIAKAMNSPITDGASTSVDRCTIGTPEYMSPEQLRSDDDIDTRADVYALGGVLYKLLTGVAPPDRVTFSKGNVRQWTHAICETPPVIPSKRVEESASPSHSAGSISSRQLRYDLDWIVMKALEKDRSQRYESAAELAADIERHLNCEPVIAAPSSMIYRLQKFIRRNRALVTASVLIVAALIAGTIGATLGLVRAERERINADLQWRRAESEREIAVAERLNAETQEQRAIAETIKAMQLAQKLDELIGSASPRHGHSPEFTLRQQLDKFAASLGEDFQNHPQLEARLRQTFGRLYLSFREVQKAGPQLKRAWDLRLRVLDEDASLTLQSGVDYAWYLMFASRAREADDVVTSLLPRLRAAGPSDELVQALDLLGRIRSLYDDDEQRDAFRREAWSVAGEFFGDHHPVTFNQQARFASVVLNRSGESDEAEQLSRAALSGLRKIYPEEHVDIARAKHCLARLLLRKRDLVEAEQLTKEAIEVDRKLTGKDSIFVVHGLVLLAKIQRADSRRDEAVGTAREAVDIAEGGTIEGDRQRIEANAVFANLVRRFDPDSAIDAYLRAVKARQRLLPDHRAAQRGIGFRSAAIRYWQLERIDEATECYRLALKVLRENPDDTDPLALTLHAFAVLLQEAGNPKEAEKCLTEAIAICDSESSNWSFVLVDLPELLLELGKLEEAQTHAETLTARAEKEQSAELLALACAAQAQIKMADSDVETAVQLLQKSLKQFDSFLNIRLRTRIDCLLAECHVQLGNYDQAESFLLQSPRNTRRLSSTFDQLRVQRQLVALYEAWEKPEKASYWREFSRR